MVEFGGGLSKGGNNQSGIWDQSMNMEHGKWKLDGMIKRKLDDVIKWKPDSVIKQKLDTGLRE